MFSFRFLGVFYSLLDFGFVDGSCVLMNVWEFLGTVMMVAGFLPGQERKNEEDEWKRLFTPTKSNGVRKNRWHITLLSKCELQYSKC